MKSKKLTIMKTRPDISDEEIREMMDFNNVLEKHRAMKKTSHRLRAGDGWKFIVPGLLAIVVVGWLLWPQPDAAPEVKQPAVTPELSVEKPKEPAIKPVQEQKITTKKSQEAKAEKPAPVTPANQTTDVYTEAEPLSGYPDLYAYFQKELTYPVEALKDSTEGIVSVSFVIGRSGKPEQIKIQNSLGTAFDSEAIRVISNMPEWKPASLNGKPVPARISMPLTFQIDRHE
jgi:TonB family protein